MLRRLLTALAAAWVFACAALPASAQSLVFRTAVFTKRAVATGGGGGGSGVSSPTAVHAAVHTGAASYTFNPSAGIASGQSNSVFYISASNATGTYVSDTKSNIYTCRTPDQQTGSWYTGVCTSILTSALSTGDSITLTLAAVNGALITDVATPKGTLVAQNGAQSNGNVAAFSVAQAVTAGNLILDCFIDDSALNNSQVTPSGYTKLITTNWASTFNMTIYTETAPTTTTQNIGGSFSSNTYHVNVEAAVLN